MFGTVDIKVRPLKLAFLVSPRDSKQVREAIRLCSSLWGGAYFPIIPLYERVPATWSEIGQRPKAKDVVIGYLDAFDPDRLVEMTDAMPDYIKALRIERIKPADIWSLAEDRFNTPRIGIGIFEILGDIFEQYFRYTPRYPVRVTIPKIPRTMALFWASVFGELPADVANGVDKAFLEPLAIEKIKVTPKSWVQLMRGDMLFPRRLTQHAINPHRRRLIRGDAAVFFLDARKLDDVIDYWNLRATGRNIFPLPKQLRHDADVKNAVVGFLKANRIPWRHDTTVCDVASFIRSRHSTMEDMQAFASSLLIDRDPADPSNDGHFVLQHWYPRVWDEWARDKDAADGAELSADKEETSIEIAETDDLSFTMKPKLPAFASHIGAGRARCANDLSLRLYGDKEYLAEVLPKPVGEQLERVINGRLGLGSDWRVGREGLVKFVKWVHPERRDFLRSEDVMFAWLKDLGWQAALSSPGILALQILRRLGGFVNILKNEKLLGLLEHMNGGRVQRDGSPVSENVVTQERHLTVSEVIGKLKEIDTSHSLHDHLLEKEVFKLGAVVACPRCMRSSWYALSALRESVTCPKCLNVFPAIGSLERSKWSYKTTGPFSVGNYAEGAYSVLLALSFFDDYMLTTMRSTRVVSFTAEGTGKRRLEADFAAFWADAVYGDKQNGVAFGECKTYGKFAKADCDRMAYIARTFPGAVIVFATLRKSLTPKEITAIAKIAKTGRKYWKAERPMNPVLILTGTELLGWHGPPFCWEDAHGKKFDRVRGLLDICDATQQIYLGLPSWQATWQEKWDREAARRAKRRVM